jgi:8-oxo-dGTP diphosphatase
MTGELATTIRKVAWLHVADRRLLCARSEGKTAFYVPGGKPEPGEDDAATLIREVREELGVSLDAATIAPAGSFTAPADGKPGVSVAVEAFFAAHCGTIAPCGEIAELRFLTHDPEVEVSAVTRAILHHLGETHVID